MNSSNNQPPGPRTDSTGTPYWVPAPGPAPTGTPATIGVPGGTVPGWVNGNTVVKSNTSK